MHDWQQLAAIVAVLTGVTVALKYLWRLVKLGCRKVAKMFGVNDIRTDLECVAQQMEFVVNELKPNGGMSIRDSLNRIEIRQVLQEQRQKAILSDMSVGVFETDNHGDYIWVNRKYLRMTGRAPSEVNGSGWINTVAERDRERVKAEWDEAIAEGREFESHFMIITPDNGRLEVCIRTYKMVDSNNAPLGFMGMVTPVNEMGTCETEF